MSDFGGLFVGLSGLTAQRYGLEVTGQNMANSSTVGYHAQSATFQATGSTVPAFYSTGQAAGNGVMVTGTFRDYDQFLQQRLNQEHASNASLAGKQRTLSSVESIMGEPSDTGIQKQMQTYWADWQAVGSNTVDKSVRTALLEQGKTVAGGLNQAAGSLDNLWTASQQQLSSITKSASTTLAQVATLNGQIQNAQGAGDSPNALLDQRDTLLTQLSEQLGATSTTQQDGTVSVYLGGTAVVQGLTSQTLTLTGPTTMAGVPVGGGSAVQIAIKTSSGTSAVGGVGGTAGALLDAVDTTIPSYRDQLDTVALTLASQVNAKSVTGYDLTGAAGTAFFSGTTASTLTVAISSGTQIAASANAPAPGPPVVPSANGTNALDISQLSLSPTSADTQYASMIANLGVASQTATNRAATQQAITTVADQDQQSATGVDIDTEATKLIMYQTAYQASAKYISTVSQTLADLMAML